MKSGDDEDASQRWGVGRCTQSAALVLAGDSSVLSKRIPFQTMERHESVRGSSSICKLHLCTEETCCIEHVHVHDMRSSPRRIDSCGPRAPWQRGLDAAPPVVAGMRAMWQGPDFFHKGKDGCAQGYTRGPSTMAICQRSCRLARACGLTCSLEGRSRRTSSRGRVAWLPCSYWLAEVRWTLAGRCMSEMF